jgi:hypothetical protein
MGVGELAPDGNLLGLFPTIPGILVSRHQTVLLDYARIQIVVPASRDQQDQQQHAD